MAKEYIEKWSAVNKLTDIENKCQKFKPFNEAEQEMYRLICETEINIGKTPAADVVERKRGRWKFHKDGSGTCDQCHFTQKHIYDDDGWQNYCGVCGADMRERRDNDAAD